MKLTNLDALHISWLLPDSGPIAPVRFMSRAFKSAESSYASLRAIQAPILSYLNTVSDVIASLVSSYGLLQIFVRWMGFASRGVMEQPQVSGIRCGC
jgi:hypothetical protein